MLHREDGPAWYGIERNEWWFHGRLHRLDGPAIMYRDGHEEWWVNSRNITDEVKEWMDRMDIKPWRKWGDFERTLFRLSF